MSETDIYTKRRAVPPSPRPFPQSPVWAAGHGNKALPAAGGGGSVRFPPDRPRSRRGHHHLCLAHSQTWVWKLRGRATACVPSPHSTQEQINTRTNHPSSASASCAQPHPHPEENKTKERTLRRMGPYSTARDDQIQKTEGLETKRVGVFNERRTSPTAGVCDWFQTPQNHIPRHQPGAAVTFHPHPMWSSRRRAGKTRGAAPQAAERAGTKPPTSEMHLSCHCTG